MPKGANIKMKKINISGAQNVEVSKKLPCEKSLAEQLDIMEEYTAVHKASLHLSKEKREINCLNVIFPRLFRKIEEYDLIAGRLDFLPVGFGSVTSVGGVGHYCIFDKLQKFRDELDSDENKKRVDKIGKYWEDHDVKALYCRDILTEDTIGRFIDCNYPLMATARLSGMMLDYPKLLDNGIDGLEKLVKDKIKESEENEFFNTALETLDLYKKVVDYEKVLTSEALKSAASGREKELILIAESLSAIRNDKPKTFHQALQMFWLYALLAGCINYGHLDDYLGPYLKQDLEAGIITEEDAYKYLKSLWTLIENRRTTVNGRIITGGYGRKNVEAADIFTRIALKVTKDCKYVEPQFTLRITKETPQDIMDMAYDCIGEGVTYPTLYNDEVNISAVI